MAARKPFFIFTLLALYIVLQFGWWVYLLYQQGIVIQELEAGRVAPDHRSYSLSMVIGEGSVFLLIVLSGLYLAYRAYRKELELIRAKDNFLMAVTHELRTPIAGIRLNLQTLERSGLSPEQRKSVMDRALDNTKRLQTLSDHILLAAQNTSTNTGSISKAIDVSMIVLNTCNGFIQRAETSHRINMHIEEGILVAIDPDAMTSIIENLLQNALNYAPNGTDIQISLTKSDDGVLLEVMDQGPGISNEQKKLVFEKFYRGGEEMTRSTKGTGLGLFIVRALVKQAGGRISIKDNDPSGSIFTVLFA
jgi:signal transduction histidine kinase